MRGLPILGALLLVAGCGGAKGAPSAGPDRPVTAEGDSAGKGGDDAAADSAPGDTAPTSKCKPSETKDVPPTTEPLCGPEVCLDGEPGGLATCIDTKHKGCTHYLLVRVSPDRSTAPLSVYVRCPSGAEEGKPRGTKVEGTLMQSYKETGVPSLPVESEQPAKACTHIFAIDCPTEP